MRQSRGFLAIAMLLHCNTVFCFVQQSQHRQPEHRSSCLFSTHQQASSNMDSGDVSAATTAANNLEAISYRTSFLLSQSAAAAAQLNPVELLCISKMDEWHTKSLSIKCPFFRRRMADVLDAMDMVLRFLVIRHKSLEFIKPPPGCRATTVAKNTHLDASTLLEIVRKDWKTNTNKGYYITGRLNTTIYRDNCVFDGPDPDMPVKGLRKYLNAASHIFDHAKSHAELLSLRDVSVGDTIILQATWKLNGVLHLPWRPNLPEWTGSTTYHFDEDSLVHLHQETWDMSVVQAFAETLFPAIAKKVWNK